MGAKKTTVKQTKSKKADQKSTVTPGRKVFLKSRTFKVLAVLLILLVAYKSYQVITTM